MQKDSEEYLALKIEHLRLQAEYLRLKEGFNGTYFQHAHRVLYRQDVRFRKAMGYPLASEFEAVDRASTPAPRAYGENLKFHLVEICCESKGITRFVTEGYAGDRFLPKLKIPYIWVDFLAESIVVHRIELNPDFQAVLSKACFLRDLLQRKIDRAS